MSKKTRKDDHKKGIEEVFEPDILAAHGATMRPAAKFGRVITEGERDEMMRDQRPVEPRI